MIAEGLYSSNFLLQFFLPFSSFFHMIFCFFLLCCFSTSFWLATCNLVDILFSINKAENERVVIFSANKLANNWVLFCIEKNFFCVCTVFHIYEKEWKKEKEKRGIKVRKWTLSSIRYRGSYASKRKTKVCYKNWTPTPPQTRQFVTELKSVLTLVLKLRHTC